MAGKVEVKAFGKEADLLESYQKVIRKQGQMLSSLRKVAKEAKSGAATAKEGNAKWSGGITTMLSQYASLAGAVALVTSGLQEQARAAKESANQIAAAQSALAASSFSSPSQFTKEEFQNLLDTIGKETNTTQAALQRLGAVVGSSAAGATKAQIESALREGAKLGALSTDLPAPDLAQAALTISSISGSSNSRESLGFLAQIGKNVQISDIGEVARTVPPALRALTQLGGVTLEQGGELFTLFNKSAVDPQGAKALTAGVSFGTRLFKEKTIPSVDESGNLTFDFLANVNPELAARGGLNETIAFIKKRIAALPPELRAEAGIKFAVGKGSSRITSLGLIQGSQATEKLFNTIQENTPAPSPESELALRDVEDFVKSQQGFNIQQARRSRLKATELARLANPRAALASEIRAATRSQSANLPEGFGGAITQGVTQIRRLAEFVDPSLEQALAGLENLKSRALAAAAVEGTPQAERKVFADRIDNLLERFNTAIDRLNDNVVTQTNEVRRQTKVLENPAGPNGATNRESSIDIATENQ